MSRESLKCVLQRPYLRWKPTAARPCSSGRDRSATTTLCSRCARCPYGQQRSVTRWLQRIGSVSWAWWPSPLIHTVSVTRIALLDICERFVNRSHHWLALCGEPILSLQLLRGRGEQEHACTRTRRRTSESQRANKPNARPQDARPMTRSNDLGRIYAKKHPPNTTNKDGGGLALCPCPVSRLDCISTRQL